MRISEIIYFAYKLFKYLVKVCKKFLRESKAWYSFPNTQAKSFPQKDRWSDKNINCINLRTCLLFSVAIRPSTGHSTRTGLWPWYQHCTGRSEILSPSAAECRHAFAPPPTRRLNIRHLRQRRSMQTFAIPTDATPTMCRGRRMFTVRSLASICPCSCQSAIRSIVLAASGARCLAVVDAFRWTVMPSSLFYQPHPARVLIVKGRIATK